ncbi:MAG: polysaccharide deacetylase family protein [Defluviitaleaceae bacterium]|nr:polysaccharide deacetylase family protein [Defluviitaleaceae bacterium]
MTVFLLMLGMLFGQGFEDTEVFFREAREVHVPVIMYHLVTEKPGQVGKYGIRPGEMEADLVFLRDNGYVTVFMQDLIDFVEEGRPLPEKPIVLSFDDGNFSDYLYLLSLFVEYDMKAVLAVTGKFADDSSKKFAENPKLRYPNTTWAQVKELHDSGHFEIQNHSHNLHSKGGSGEKRGEAVADYHSRLAADLQKLQDLCQQHIGVAPTTFVYPLGVIGKDSRRVLEDLGMKASLSCFEGKNMLRKGDRDALFEMHRFNRPSGTTVKAILDRIK